MWFLIKGSFWFSLVLVALSFFSTNPSANTEAARPLEMADAFNAATGAYQYIAGLCLEKPDVCEKGAETFSALSYRAREGALVAFEFLDRQLREEEAAKLAAAEQATEEPATEVVTGTIAPTIPVPQKKPAL